MARKSRLSRKYIYARLTNLNVDLSTANIKRVAFMQDPTAEPSDDDPNDWHEAIVVADSESDLWEPSIGPAIAILEGPLRGDEITGTEHTVLPGIGKYMMWSDWKVPNSDERNTDWHGPVELVAAPGGF